jgi:uncharacterized membrane protein AbrB (regulator of aidB expression)
MNEAAVGLTLLIGLSVVCAVVANLRTRDWLLAAVVSALAASTLFQIGLTIKLGHLDKFAPIALVVGGMWAFLIALGIGAGFQLWRRRSGT